MVFSLIETGLQGLFSTCGLRFDKDRFGYDCYKDAGNVVLILIKAGVDMVVVRMLEILSSV